MAREIVIRGCLVEIEDEDFAREMEQLERQTLQQEVAANNLME